MWQLKIMVMVGFAAMIYLSTPEKATEPPRRVQCSKQDSPSDPCGLNNGHEITSRGLFAKSICAPGTWPAVHPPHPPLAPEPPSRN